MQAKAALAEQCGLNKQVGPGLDFSFSTVQEENLKKKKKKGGYLLFAKPKFEPKKCPSFVSH